MGMSLGSTGPETQLAEARRLMRIALAILDGTKTDSNAPIYLDQAIAELDSCINERLKDDLNLCSDPAYNCRGGRA